jgi:hyperosmotically inducible periplasmic protein
MKTTIVAVTWALCSAACAGSNPPAQDPSSAAAETTTPVAQTGTVTTTASMAPSTTPTTTTTPAPGSGATSMMAPPANGGSMSPPAATTPVTDAPGPAPANPGDHTGSADNTRVNARDRSGTLTPMSQGNSTSEIGITASIRKGVMRDGTLSFTAKNVKIITVGTTVTLRGPVKSDAERTTIENLARQTAGVTAVDDQLEVK